MPTAILLLRKNDAPAARTLCEGFLAIRSAAESKNTSQTLQNTLPLRWLLNVSQASPGQLRDCGFLTRHYDWQRADTLLGKIQWQHGAPTGAGPYIVVIQATAGGLRAAAADASKLTSRAQLRRLPQQFDKAVRQTLEGVATQERHDRLLMELHGWWQIGSNVLKLAFPPAEAAVNIIDGVIELTEAYES
jgi:hypothetical protein